MPKNAKRIKNSFDYITPDGVVYKQVGDTTGLFIKAKQNDLFGYKIVGILYKGKITKTKRVHRLVAETFLENKNNYPIVMHLDNDKSNNNIDNLRWGTISENTQQAFDDGLCINDKGYNDSQSMEVDMFMVNGKYIKSFGSISEASRKTKIPKSTIARHCKQKIYPRKHAVYFRYAS